MAISLSSKQKNVDMTQGSIMKHLLTFALPLLVGNIFQQLYNTVDTWVVGNYVSNEAFAAVGSVGPVINMLIGFFTGLSSGAGVVISQFYGAKQHEKVSQTVHTAIVMTAVLAVVFTAVGLIMTPFMLEMMNTDADVLPQSTAYLNIYFAGIVGLMFYNIGAGILRAVGDSRRPFYFLVVAAVMNTVLDLVFVLGCGMKVEGVALATVISQGVSSVLVMLTLMRTGTCVKVEIKKLRCHWEMLKKIFLVGIPAALQMAVTSFSNVFVQSYVNFFGKDHMSAWTAYSKIDQLIFLPMQSIALASTTFVGQNLGSNQVKRARKGVGTALLLALAATGIVMVPVLLFAPQLVRFFNSEPKVVEYGSELLYYLTPFYLLCAVNQIYSGALRGAGDSRAPMVIMLGSYVAFRQAYLYVVTKFIANDFLLVAMGYPAGWLLCSVFTALYYHRAQLGKNRLVEA